MKKLIKHIQKEWYKYFLEILVLIIGIYGAFALENWNENRQNKKLKDNLIKSLISEFENNLNQIDTVLYYHGEVSKSAKHLLAITNTKSLPSPELLDSLILRFYYSWTFDPVNGALTSAISSGQIHLLENEPLINILFAWKDKIDDATEDEIFARESLVTDKVIERHISLQNSFSIFNPIIFPGKKVNNFKKLFDDPDLENYLLIRILWIEQAIYELESVKKLNIEILHTLKAIK